MVKEGYKETQIGILPQSWKVTTLEEEYFLFAGGDLDLDDFSELPDGKYKYEIYSNALQNRGIYGYCSNPRYTGNAITITGRGDIGHCFYRKEAFSAIVRLLVCQPKGEISSLFVAEYLEMVQPFVFESTGVPQLTVPQINRIKIPLPDIQEQNKIAEVLSDTDNLISSLEKLIEKKKTIKKGAMQELLTGKKRLPGFSGEWQDVTLGECCEIYDGTHQTPNYTEYGMPFYSVENVTADDFANTKYISFKEHELLNKNRRMEKGDVLMTRIGSIGDCKYIDWDVNASFYVSLALIKCKKKISGQFLSYYSHTEKFKKEIEIRSLLTAIPQKINLGPISEIVINVPTDINEQNAITEIIFDMDNEIKKLEQKLAKYQKLKQGMMQQLLTGKIRLI